MWVSVPYSTLTAVPVNHVNLGLFLLAAHDQGGPFLLQPRLNLVLDGRVKAIVLELSTWDVFLSTCQPSASRSADLGTGEGD